MTDGRAKMLVAYHEAGHAIAATLTPGHDPVQKLSLIPRGQARGLTWFLPGKPTACPPCSLCRAATAPAPGHSCTRAGMQSPSGNPTCGPRPADEDGGMMSKQQMFASIVGALGGRAAEEAVWGKSEVTTGAAGDLQQVHDAWRTGVWLRARGPGFLSFPCAHARPRLPRCVCLLLAARL